ncbi:copper chaperone PCu(A)C [Szabonella alba]|uniref:Copper chaperone PCu(A)C n=1 Tax=Szabonella alba TaxID=2804194 RepID=A0A8K0VB67_9RHOB|nr:copper chaperone PCu(A)C [Szabonella alba]MBL4917766.1 copper chaperone PCu(A)C [Szabonella alba]
MFRTGMVLALLLATPAALAHGVTQGDIELIHPHIPQPVASARAAAGYLGIVNEGPEADRLIGIESRIAAKIDLHVTEHHGGVARMVALEAVEIPPGEVVLLEPDGMHIMLMGLTTPLVEGEMHPVTFIFERAGRIDTEFQIDPPGGADHSHHSP